MPVANKEVQPSSDGSAAPQQKYITPAMKQRMATNRQGPREDGEEVFTLRVSNISEEVDEYELKDMFNSIAQADRVRLVKDMETGVSKGFAFVNYSRKEDAEAAMKKYHGQRSGYLILSVEWAMQKRK